MKINKEKNQSVNFQKPSGMTSWMIMSETLTSIYLACERLTLWKSTIPFLNCSYILLRFGVVLAFINR